MKRNVSILLFVILGFVSFGFTQTLEDIEWYTEEYPPYNYVENGVIRGLSVDILLLVWAKTGVNKTRKDIHAVPWARGVRTIKTTPGTCLFTTSITAERKETLGWKFVFPVPQISDDVSHIIAKKTIGLKFHSIENLKAYNGSFGVVRGDVGASLLVNAGVNPKRIDKAPTPESLITKLIMGRHDLISYGFPTTRAIMIKKGINPDDYEIVFSFPNRPHGYAFHRNTSPKVIDRLQKALDELYREGTVQKIMEKYTLNN